MHVRLHIDFSVKRRRPPRPRLTDGGAAITERDVPLGFTLPYDDYDYPESETPCPTTPAKKNSPAGRAT